MIKEGRIIRRTARVEGTESEEKTAVFPGRYDAKRKPSSPLPFRFGKSTTSIPREG
jgi:hypothetical protein